MPASIYLAFLWAPKAEILGDTSRIVYFHVPIAWLSVLAFIISGISSIILLFDKKNKFHLLEEKAYNSALIGIIFTVLTTITGSMWAKLSWGTYWNWDPRETSIIILLIIYISYFSLWSALKDNPAKGRIASVYLIIAMVTVPFLVFVIPRVYSSLHPNPIINQENKIHMDTSMRITLLMSAISFTMLYFYIFDILNRIAVLKNKIKEKYYE